jgi:hypothetical protein
MRTAVPRFHVFPLPGFRLTPETLLIANQLGQAACFPKPEQPKLIVADMAQFVNLHTHQHNSALTMYKKEKYCPTCNELIADPYSRGMRRGANGTRLPATDHKVEQLHGQRFHSAVVASALVASVLAVLDLQLGWCVRVFVWDFSFSCHVCNLACLFFFACSASSAAFAILICYL